MKLKGVMHMAWLQVDIFSRCLMRSVPLQVVIPAEKLPEGSRGLKTVYLLNGYTGDGSEWLMHADLSQLAARYRACFVTVSGENGFYTDHPLSGLRYREFVGRELPELTRSFLPLSARREDTVLAGESMGGYGALHAGMKYAGTFGSILSLSPGLVFSLLPTLTDGEGNLMDMRRSMFDAIFGDADSAPGSEYEPAVAARLPGERTDIFLSCGRGDTLYGMCAELAQSLGDAGWRVFFDAADGGHDWAYWPAALDRGLARAFGAPGSMNGGGI